MTTLDRIDYGIIEALQNNARLSNKELAARIGLAPSSCLDRVRKLEGRGVLAGYHARVSEASLGVHLQAVVYLELGTHTGCDSDVLVSYLEGLPEVVALFNVAGRWDFLLHVAVPSVDHLKEFTQYALAARTEVRRIETSLVFDYRRKSARQVWPDSAEDAVP